MQEVADVDEVPPGELISVEVDGEKVLIANVDGAFHAIGDVCTHQHCLLSDGWLERKDVVCPCHASKFNLESGEPDRPPATEPEPTYDVVVEDGVIKLDV